MMIEIKQQPLPAAWSTTDAPYPALACVHQLFEAQVEQTPDAIAVVFEDRSLTYRELNQRANQLAYHLRATGIGVSAQREDLVGICMDRSLEIMVAILGVLKAGGAYVPLDPAYPVERLAFMLNDTQAPALITQQHIPVEHFNTSARVIYLDHSWTTIAEEPDTNPICEITPDNLAYAIYTSGSTGQAKGVLIPHRGLCNLATVQALTLDIQPDSRILQFASFGFDASLWDIVMALLTGATLYITPPDARGPGIALTRLLRNQRITIATLPPAVLAALTPEQVPDLQTIVSTGEACTKEIVARWQGLVGGRQRRFFNGYGPTETTVGATIGECVADGRKPSIGRPFANLQVYLLDCSLNLVPSGQVGEIYVGGVGVARGYLNQPGLTAEKFLPNPFSTEFGARLYRTGDLARYRADGTLEYIDRCDRQVKLRGYRIELGEIETVLQQHPSLRESAVLLREDIPGTKRLVAYVTQRLDAASVQEQVEQWQALSDETYRERSANHDPTLNFVGWNSSYDGLPLPEAAIRELVEHTADRILALRPERMLEIGCGTGMLLFRIAPHCAEYWASDFSGEALHYLQQQLDRPEQNLPQVRLLHQAADSFDNLDADSFDVVALNSVAQYFPSIEYLVQVIEGAVRVTKPGGRIFIGDLRNKDLLEAFHALVQWHRSPGSASLRQLRQRFQKNLASEEELVVAPGFFHALQQHLPRIGHIEMQLKRGRFHNEFTQFRFDVVLHIESEAVQTSEIITLDWALQHLTLAEIEFALSEFQPANLVVTGVPNPRLTLPTRLLDRIANAPDSTTVDVLRDTLQATEDCHGVEPEDVWSLEQRLPYTIKVMWSDNAQADTFDIVFERRGANTATWSMSDIKQTKQRGQPWSSFANKPKPRKTNQQLVPELRRIAQERLPAHMVPAIFVLLDDMPHTINGKIDRAALPAPELTRPEIGEAFVAPRDTIELQLVQIWEEVLQLRPVGITDNFFDLGGHSLLAVRLLSQIHDLFGQELPLSTLSHDPTVEALAAHLRQPNRLRSRSPLVCIQRGGTKHPLFCIHPVGGSILSYADLSRHLSPDQPIYGLSIDSLDDLPSNHSIEDLAVRYIAGIRSVQPHGPYLLGGWSFGGLVAFEIARQLQAHGEQIVLLAMLDTWAPLPGNVMADYTDDVTPFTFFAKDLERRFVQPLPVLPDSALRHLDPEARLRYLLKLTQIVMGISAQYETDQIQRQLAIYQANLRAAAAYLPTGTYSEQITVFQAEELFSTNPPIATLGWNQFTSEPVEVCNVPGNHLTMFSEPHIAVLAKHLQHCLDQVHAGVLGLSAVSA